MATPLHQQLRDDLEHQIRSGTLPLGSRLPTEAQLQQEHGVSRGTAQRALNELARDGLVLRRRRHGTVVVDQTRQENLLRFTDPLVSNHMLPGRHVLQSSSVVQASDVPFEMPGIDPDVAVNFLGRQKLDDEQRPIGMEWCAVPFALAPRLLEEDHTTLRLMSYYREHGLTVDKTRLYLDPVTVDADTATLIGCEPGTPVLQRRRYAWLTDGRLMEAGIYLLNPNAIQFYIEHSVDTQAS